MAEKINGAKAEQTVKQQYRTLKKRFKFLVYENECYQEQLRNLQRKLLKLSRDKNFLLDRLQNFEKVSDSSDDSEIPVEITETSESSKKTASRCKESGDMPAAPPKRKRVRNGKAQGQQPTLDQNQPQTGAQKQPSSGTKSRKKSTAKTTTAKQQIEHSAGLANSQNLDGGSTLSFVNGQQHTMTPPTFLTNFSAPPPLVPAAILQQPQSSQYQMAAAYPIIAPLTGLQYASSEIPSCDNPTTMSSQPPVEVNNGATSTIRVYPHTIDIP